VKLFFVLLVAFLYIRGWLRDSQRRPNHLAAFLGGLLALFIALDSPLDTLDAFYLSAHMTQHLLLIMVAPALILLGHPLLPFLRAFPKTFAREAFGPFLTSPALRWIGRGVIYPPIAWLLFAISTICWHIPALYQLALHSPSWHGVQHACFFWTGILFWWPVVEPVIGNDCCWPRWAFIPYLLLADIVNTALSASFVFSGSLLYPDYALLSSIPAAQHDQTLAGLIMWVPGSLIYLVPSAVIAATILTPARGPQPKRSKTKLQLIQIDGAPRTLLIARRPLQLVMFVLALIVIVLGLTGPRLGALNLATILPWTYWRALSIGALLIVGNVFCMACPFTLARDIARRVLPATRSWPRVLRNKWIPVTLFALYLWSYEAFSLWDKPFTTALIVVGYFTAAIAIDGTFRGASFCKYVCPIGQFHFVASTLSPAEVRVQDP
jgi:cytochrome c oxidase assembly factor CtaG